MNYLPITAIALRHVRLIRNYLNRILFTFYWPSLDILMWGFLGKWMQTVQNNNHVEALLLLSILLWTVFGRIGTEIFISLLEEFWSHNLINIFASPITLGEWFVGTLLYVTLLFPVLISYLLFLIWIFYDVSILFLLKNFIIFAPALFLSAISISFLILSIVIYFGNRVNEVAFALMWSFMPFSGVFYPVKSLPLWGQKISAYLPMSYVFTAMHNYVLNQTSPVPYLFKSCILSLIYGLLFSILFFYMFNKSKDKGLARLTD